MRAVHSLPRLAEQCEGRLAQLHGLVDVLPTVPAGDDDRVVAYATIEALNLWASFSRAMYLSCVFSARRANGKRVLLGKHKHITSAPQAIDFAIKTLKHRLWKSRRPPWRWSDEPKWYDPSALTRLSPALALSNVSQIQAAFGVSTTVFRHLPTLRNFYAHRGEDTATKVRALIADDFPSLGFTSRTTPTEFLCTRLPGRPQNLLADWIDDLRQVVSLLPA